MGAGASDSGTDGGAALSGVASFRSLAAAGKGVAGAGASLAGVSRGVETGGSGDGDFFISFFARTDGAEDAGSGCVVSGDGLTGAGVGNGGAGVGRTLSGVAALRSLAAAGKGVVRSGTSLSGVICDVEAGGVARRSGGEGAFFDTFFAKTV